ncbi:MAG: hypothetical protein ACREVI_03145 [Steroidobacteraceae bacterium]
MCVTRGGLPVSIFNGQFFDRAAPYELLVFAEQQAGSARANFHLLWDAVNSPLFRVQIAD